MELTIAYNAKKGLLNSALDWSHKIVSPSTYSCDLCSITYGVFGMKKEWNKFLSELPIPIKFIYKKEFLSLLASGEITVPVATKVPHIALKNDKVYAILIDSKQFQQLKSLDELIRQLKQELNKKDLNFS